MKGSNWLAPKPGYLLALLLLVAVLIFALLHWGGVLEQEPDSAPMSVQPNVLLILLDDLGLNNLSMAKGSEMKTPNLDQFARQGIYFTRHYTDAVCAPSRAALITGRLPASVGFHTYRAGISPQVYTLPEQFQANGYNTHMLGKWHLGSHYASARPENQGFDTWLGLLEATQTVAAQKNNKYKKISYYDPWLENERGEYRQYRGHLTDLLAEHAGSIIQRGETPWFLYLAFLAPHSPIMPSRDYARRYPDNDRGRYMALIEQLDQAVSRVLKSVRDSGQWDNTIIIIASDNGGTERYFPDNSPYRGKKTEYLEGGVRTPLMVWWKGHWEGGKINDNVVSIIDIAPTLLESAGITPDPQLQGRNLFAEPIERPLYWYQETPGLSRKGMLSADGNWRWLRGTDHEPLLLDRDGFSSGQPNQYATNPARVREMEENYQSWLRRVTAVELRAQEKPNKWWHYTGDDYRRTPVTSSYSIGFGLVRSPDKNSKVSSVIATQAGYLNLRNDENGKLILRFDGHRTILPQLLEQPGCHSLFITAFMKKERGRSTFRKGPSTLQVFFDGKPVLQEEYVNLVHSDKTPASPLKVNTDPANSVSGVRGMTPIVSTRRLSQDEIRSHHRQMVAACRVQGQ